MKVLWPSLAIVVLVGAQALAQTRPTTQIRRGIEFPTTDPTSRQEMVFEGLIRKVEPDLNGVPSRMPAYLNFFKREFVRDPRLFAADISVGVEPDGTIAMRGFVEHDAHRQMFERMLMTLGFEKLDDRIELAGRDDDSLGIVRSPRAILYDRIDKPRETITECLSGEPVFLLRRAGDYYWIHASDGYVGYIEAIDVLPVPRKHFTEWISSAHAILRSEFKSARESLPVGAWVRVLSSADPNVDCRSAIGGSITLPLSKVAQSGSLATMQKIEGVILAASKLMGTKYVWGGRTSEGVDCSGLTQLAFKSQGINLPRDADQQAYVGRFVATATYRDAMSRGDLMFFMSRRGTIAHVAIYLGENQFIEAGDQSVKISSLNPADQNYEPKRDRSFVFARRVIE